MKSSETQFLLLQSGDSHQQYVNKEAIQGNITQQSNGNLTEDKKKRKKKRRTKRNKTAPAPLSGDDNDRDTGVVLKPFAWRTPPPSLNGFPGNKRRLEPLRPPLRNGKYGCRLKL